jgi:hypothetical protein
VDVAEMEKAGCVMHPPFCVECKVSFRCEANGVVLYYGGGHCYRGDKFKCPKCGNEILSGFSGSFFGPEYITKGEKVGGGRVIQAPEQLDPRNKTDRFELIGE